jgi:hypothetical protein
MIAPESITVPSRSKRTTGERMELMLTTAYDAPVRSRAALVCLSMLAIAWSVGTEAVRADIDGDGRSDTVLLMRSAHFFRLRVVTGDRVITKAVRGFSGPKASGIGDPRILALRPMNARRGLEIEVEVWRGAANAFLIFYALDHGQLVAMRGGPHDPADPAYVWDVGGTIGTGTAQADCVRRVQVGVLDEWNHRGIWHYRETIYEVRGTRFVKTKVYELASERMVNHLPTDWPKVRRLDFASCGGVAAAG